MYYVYIIYSEKLDRYYVGTTDNIEKRLIEHNTDFYKNSFTSRGIPWELKLKFQSQSSEKAYKLERFIKSMKSRKFIETLIINPDILKEIESRF